MTIADLADVLEAEVVCGEDRLSDPVGSFAACDLLSDVLSFEKEGYALLTGLTNAQIIRTADITSACCVVIGRVKQPQQEAIVLARRCGIPLLLSALNLFDACCRIGRYLETHDGGA